MIELLGTWLMTYDSGFDVLRYLTVRTIGGTLTALMLSIFLGPTLIKFLSHNCVMRWVAIRSVWPHQCQSAWPRILRASRASLHWPRTKKNRHVGSTVADASGGALHSAAEMESVVSATLAAGRELECTDEGRSTE